MPHNNRESELTQFLVSVEGSVEFVEFEGGVNDAELYVRYEVVMGPDWTLLSGLRGAISQLGAPGRDARRVIFNLPLQFVLSSTNVSGWPQLILSVYGITSTGVEGVRGYARAFLPTSPGPTRLRLAMYRPRSATQLGAWLAWFTGRVPELVDPSVLATGSQQHLMRTESYGTVTVSVSIVTKDFHKLGYDNQPGVSA